MNDSKTSTERINVTKTFLPPIQEYQKYLGEIWQNNQLTNQGPLVKRFEQQASEFLGVGNFHFVTNGTLALQIALKALAINGGEIITTPFSYVATASSILWENCQPVFVDIDPKTLCIDPAKIEAAISDKTKAIMPVHVFGHPCDVEEIAKIAEKHNLRVIYDAAHAFGVTYKSRSLLSYGDISICSFHATKPFHTIEGGCLVVKDKETSDKVELIKRFGHQGDEHFMLGINAKASEFQAAMGLCNLSHLTDIIDGRRKVAETYDRLLGASVERPQQPPADEYNYAYYPVLLKNEAQLLKVVDKLNKLNIYPRRYFYPSLNTLPYLNSRQECPASEDIALRILCLPLYDGLPEAIIKQVSEAIKA